VRIVRVPNASLNRTPCSALEPGHQSNLWTEKV
jgi:hypothetical protein